MGEKRFKTILVTGGAGYIGSITARALLERGYDVVVLDSLIKGRRFAIDRNAAFAQKNGKAFVFEKGDLGNAAFLKDAFLRNKIDAVVHFAAFIEVCESVRYPATYFYNNIINTVRLLDVMAAAGAKRIVFSSSAAVYGEPESVPIKEDAPLNPINPYGYTKLAMERMIGYYQKMFGVEWVALRYFNAAGALGDADLGEAHYPESHLIPSAIDEIARGKKVRVFGNDYDTADGTCLRDYVDVVDLAEAHRLALELSGAGLVNRPYNLGSGRGFTVSEVVREVGRAMKKEPKVEYAARRPGDPAKLVASSETFQEAAGWALKAGGISRMLETAVEWYLERPKEALESKHLPSEDEKKTSEKIKKELDANAVIAPSVKTEILSALAGFISAKAPGPAA